MKYQEIIFQKLSYWLQYFDDVPNGIPTNSGIYYWVYWPQFNPSKISLQELESILLGYTQKSLFFSESLKGTYKYEAEINELGYPQNGNIFGLPPSRKAKLVDYLQNRDNLVSFHRFFKEVCFSRPFYVGKANDLRRRLVTEHFQGKTEVIPEIDKHNISYTDIWVGYRIINDPSKEGINVIFEEIFSRRIKPGLTKKPN